MHGARPSVLSLAMLLLAACGGDHEPEELVAVPYPDEAEDLADDLGEQMTPEAAGEALEELGPNLGDDETDGRVETNAASPPLDATRELVAARGEGARASDHLLADLTGDGVREVLVATVDDAREAVVEVARWNGDDFAITARRSVGRADDLGRLRLADLGERAPRVVLLGLQLDGATRLAVWNPDENGALRPPEACPLDVPVRVRSPVGLELRLTCHADEAARRVLEWDHGAFWPTTVDREELSGAGADDALTEVLGDDGATAAE